MSVIFDQLRISDNGKRMYISVHVNKADYFENVYLDSITIVTADKVHEACMSGPSTEHIYKKVFGDNVKEADLVLEASDFMKSWEEDVRKMMFKQADMSKNLFFVYVKIKGVPGECTPCALDREYTLGVTFDETMLYQKVMDYTKQLADDCNVPSGFIDFILMWNAFKAAIETEHWIVAIDFWKRLFGESSHAMTTYSTGKPCGCHG